jgi:hypothetical protein
MKYFLIHQKKGDIYKFVEEPRIISPLRRLNFLYLVYILLAKILDIE